MMEFQPDQDKENRVAFRKLIALIFMIVFAIPIIVGFDRLSDYLDVKTYQGEKGIFLAGAVIWLFLVVISSRCIMYFRFGAIAAQDVRDAVEKSRQTMLGKLDADTYEGLLFYRRETRRYSLVFVCFLAPLSIIGLLSLGLAENLIEDLKVARCAVALGILCAWLVAIIKTRKKYPGAMEKIRAFYKYPSNFKE
ncbi:MAG: hypothetical protein JWO78_2490 [Micavibrio sp.]|nr:hypothetical protein [Micavibrio sp.]